MKKRFITLLMILCLLAGLVPAVSATEAIASGTCGENLTWVLTEDGVLTISGEGKMEDYSTKWEIPWYNEKGAIESLEITDGVTTIGNYAFCECYNLKKVTLPNTLVIIGYNAFDWCPDLSDITLPSSLTTIKAYAFRDCDALPSISIPDKVTIIEDETFMGCSSLRSATLPNGLTTIGYYAFGLSGLEEINIPDTATHIDGRAFHWTPWEENLSDGYIIVGDHVLLGYYGTTPLNGVAIIPDGVKYIASTAFGADEMEGGYYGNCKEITSIVLPDTLLEIGYWAFDHQKIQTVTIPSSVTAIDRGAFTGCEDLETVYFEGNPPTMESDIFYNDTLTAYYPTDSAKWSEDLLHDYKGDVTWVGYHAFDDIVSNSFYFEPVVWASTNGITTGATATTFDPNSTCLRAHVVTFLHRAVKNPEPAAVNNPFTDVKSSDFFYKPVLWAVEKGITNGISATKFGSYDICNRAAVVTFLYRAFGSPAVSTEGLPFTDVPAGAWYEAPIAWAVENGITNGLTATEFGPNASCNRAQVVTFLYRAYN